MKKHVQAWYLSPDDFPENNSTLDQLEFMLGYAILAPSPYNSQPWLFRLNSSDVEMMVDPSRMMGIVDPVGRELVMSLGSVLLNLRVAAEYFGHTHRIEIRPDAENPDLLVRFHLGFRGDTSSEDVLLFYAIPQRRTNRQPFEDKSVPEELLERFESAARDYGVTFQAVRDETKRQQVANLVAEGDRRQWADKQFRAELAQWVRPHPEEHADGLPVNIAGIKDWLSFAGPALIRTFDRGGGTAATDRDIALHSPVLGVLGTEQDDVDAWLNAGQALQRVLLEARAEGVFASFLNQPIEVADLRVPLAETIGLSGYPQSLLRLGYGPEISPTPRRAVRQMLLSHRVVLR